MDPLTMAVGAMAVGGIVNAFGSYSAAKAAAAAGDRQAQRMIEEARRAYADIAPMYTPYANVGPQALDEIMAWSPTEAPERFEYSRSVDEFLDPAMAYEQDQMRRSLEQSAAASGGLYSGATAKALQDRAAQLARTGYSDAYGRMERDRTFTYQDYLDDFANRRQANVDRLTQLQNLATTGLNATQGLANLRSGQATSTHNALVQSMTPIQAGASAPGAALSNFGTSIGNMGNMLALNSMLGQPAAVQGNVPPQDFMLRHTQPQISPAMGQNYNMGRMYP